MLDVWPVDVAYQLPLIIFDQLVYYFKKAFVNDGSDSFLLLLFFFAMAIAVLMVNRGLNQIIFFIAVLRCFHYFFLYFVDSWDETGFLDRFGVF